MSGWPPLEAPSFDGATGWLNSEPLTGAALRGSVVLVDFWTLTCINWLRQEPYVRAWARGYRADGLVVVGVHTPEFAFERDVDGIRRAVERFDIDYPIAVDSEYAVWEAFANHYWPALYFIDRDGMIRDQHFGEGRYEQSERVLQKLLGIERAPIPVRGHGIEAEADWETLRTPETYLGYQRSERFDSAGGTPFDEPAVFELPGRDRLNHWALEGDWVVGPECVTAARSGAILAFTFHARDAHLVMRNGSGATIPFRVALDGAAPGPAHGGDVDADGRGQLDDGRLWQLIRVPGDVRKRTLRITFDEPGAECYCFTFG